MTIRHLLRKLATRTQNERTHLPCFSSNWYSSPLLSPSFPNTCRDGLSDHLFHCITMPARSICREGSSGVPGEDKCNGHFGDDRQGVYLWREESEEKKGQGFDSIRTGREIMGWEAYCAQSEEVTQGRFARNRKGAAGGSGSRRVGDNRLESLNTILGLEGVVSSRMTDKTQPSRDNFNFPAILDVGGRKCLFGQSSAVFGLGLRGDGVGSFLGPPQMSLIPKNVRFSSSGGAVGEGVFGEGDTVQAGFAGVTDAVSDVTYGLAADVASVSEVAAAAADSSIPTAALQHLIDAIHMQTGLPWWLSIAATTVVIRSLLLPLVVYQMKATARLSLLRPELERITNVIKESGYDPKVTEVYQARMKDLFKKHKTNPFTPMMGALMQAPLFISFFFAIRNMAEKVPSFKEGGALWFTDLTTPDSLFILPVLSGLATLLTVELGAADGMQGQPMMGKMKMFFRGFAVLIIPLTASFPKALFCYWLTANLCSLAQTAVLKQPGIRKAVGIPETAHLSTPASETPTAAASIVTLSQPRKRSKKERR